MAKVLGVGGIFFKSPDPKRLSEWYAKWLNMSIEDWGGIAYLPQDMPANSQTVWSPFDASTEYFAPSEKGYKLNLMVDNLEQALKQVKEGGAPGRWRYRKDGVRFFRLVYGPGWKQSGIVGAGKMKLVVSTRMICLDHGGCRYTWRSAPHSTSEAWY